MRNDLPTGTVTFLFTDVEGSTKLLHDLGSEAYDKALVEHRRVLREAFTRHGGVEVDTQGDAFFYAFATAEGGLLAAGDGQAALSEGPISVRMGLHTGTPHIGQEGYIGGDVHLGARIAAAAHGGQVVLSVQTRELVDADITDLGEHRFKDIEAAVPIFQLGDGSFPPLKTISNTNLPRPASSFIGRDDELLVVLSQIEEGARLVTLTGPGGTGKTRLAIEVASELVPSYDAGVFWVGLATLRDAALVTEAIAQTLGAKDGLAAHIGEREMLLLVDNLEQVIGAAPELSELLTTCPNLTLLVTSRELLRVRGEVEYAVPPLAESEAVSLFCERSQLEPSEEIAELCRRLDDMPLAVELAAARTKALSPGQILERLSQRLDLLEGGRDADPRQQTLRATIDWSYELLAPNEQDCFRQLSVFIGGCTLDAAAEVSGADLNTLQSLIEKSLLRFTDERYWMLETIREYAGERLEEEGDAAHARRRRSLYFADLGIEAGPGLKAAKQEAWLQRLDAERDNLFSSFADLDPGVDAESMLRFCGYAAWAFVRGFQGVLLEPLDAALRESSEDSDHRLRALYIAATCALAVDRLDRASELSQDLLTRAPRSSDPEDMLRALDVAVGVEMAFERLDEARALVDEYLVRAREFGDPVRIADASNRVASLALETGEWGDAVAACEEGLLRRADLPASHVGMLLATLALALAMASDVDRSLDASAESLELASRLADATGVACALLPIAYLAARSDPEHAGPLVLTVARLARLENVWFERFEHSVHEQTLTMIGGIVNGGTLDESTADVDLEAAAELGRRAVMEMRASSNPHAS